MAKRTQKLNYNIAEAVVECIRDGGDSCDEGPSEEDSDVTSVDSVVEDMFMRSQDAVLDR